MTDYLSRVLADSEDRTAWLAARRTRICASDAGRLAKPASRPLYLRAKLRDGEWSGNAYTAHGNTVEHGLLAWAGIPRNTLLIHAEGEDGFAATPDGIEVLPSGELLLAEVKTTNKPFNTIPRHYLRQVWWAQYCLGATRTKFIWDEHRGFDAVALDPHIEVIDRDDDEINRMLAIARPLLQDLTEALAFARELGLEEAA